MRFRKPSQPESTVIESIAPLNDAEQEWVATHVSTAKKMLAGNLTPDGLDCLWSDLLSEDPADPNPAINVVGLGLGQLLADQTRSFMGRSHGRTQY